MFIFANNENVRKLIHMRFLNEISK